MNVLNLDPGLYHYDVRKHSLEMVVRLSEETARDWANEFCSGQVYPAWAQVLFVMTTRFYRHQWKYRDHPKAYSVLLMDAAHLSQTLYLVATELGLGCFVTAAINSINIEKRLQLDAFQEGSILICGVGIPAAKNEIDPQFQTFRPARSAGQD